MGFLGSITKNLPSILSAGGSLLDAYGKYKQGKDAKEVYEYNQALAKFEAEYVEERADVELAGLKRDVHRYISRQRAIQGKSGTVTDTGSNLDAIIATEREAEIDAQIIRRGAAVEKELALKRAEILDKQGGQVSSAGFISAGATLLGGLSKWDWKRSFLSTTPSFKAQAPTGRFNVGQFGTTAHGI